MGDNAGRTLSPLPGRAHLDVREARVRHLVDGVEDRREDDPHVATHSLGAGKGRVEGSPRSESGYLPCLYDRRVYLRRRGREDDDHDAAHSQHDCDQLLERWGLAQPELQPNGSDRTR